MQSKYKFLLVATTLSALLLQSRKVLSYTFNELPTFSRRQLIKSSLAVGAISVGVAVSTPLSNSAMEETAPKTEEKREETPEERKARILKEKIAASKKNYRKVDSYTKERFSTVDYSCVADTGSPCKQPKSVFPSDDKIARDGKIEDL
mmetsp:Transcript_1645/g.2250  ORF Transcript_1645/g.2250 Transcript_1645/m.2250 type:complete len:148 (+) Transcript_1645:61-504(+)